ncbi:AAA family ATPase [bacterium]|nr:AAA family ATPase [bacterium]
MSYVRDLIDAVALEIQEQKKKKNDQISDIYDGKKIKILANEHVYLFRSGELISFLDDSIAEIEIEGKNYDCTLNSNKHNKIQITLSQDKGNYISKAKLHLNPWFLLELLSKKLSKNIYNDSYFKNSYDLIYKKNKPILHSNIELPEQIYTRANESQLLAIKHSLEMSQTIIWGPPGTGKTATIANIIQNFIKLKKSVLLVSLSNNAVDQALFKVLDSIVNKDDFKSITRLGIPKSEMLPYFKDKYYPILLGDKVNLVCSSEIEKRQEVEKSLIKTREDLSLTQIMQ